MECCGMKANGPVGADLGRHPAAHPPAWPSDAELTRGEDEMSIRIASLALAVTAVTAVTAGLAASASAAPASHPRFETVKVETGVLQGLTVSPGTVAFLGVPYAAPPVGSLRFREPQPAAAWRGVRPAVTEPKGCISTSV